MQRWKEYLVVLVFVTSILTAVVLSYYYLAENWENIFGPTAEEFSEFGTINQETEQINNKTLYKINMKLTSSKNMYTVVISPQNSTGVTRITSFNEGLPSSRIIQAGTVIYPTMTVELDNNITYGRIEVQVSFIDIDGHEKKMYENVTVYSEKYQSASPGFEFILAIVGLSIIYLLKRKK